MRDEGVDKEENYDDEMYRKLVIKADKGKCGMKKLFTQINKI